MAMLLEKTMSGTGAPPRAVRAFVDGKPAEQNGPPRRIIDPATDAIVGEVCDSTAEEVNGAVAAARRALAGDWGEAVPRERAAVLLRLADLIERDADELSALEVAETGKPLISTRQGELPFAVDNLRFFAGAARSLAGTGAGSFGKGQTSLLLHRPVGVVGAITPWNFPLVMAVWKVGAALAAGCAVVLKPAPQTPGTAFRLAELAVEAGLPGGAFNVVNGDRAAGAAMAADPGIAALTLTGATETGRQAMASAASSVKRLQLELGGKAPVLIFDDADLEDAAAAVAMAATYNTGQDCTAATRVYVDASRFNEAVEAFSEALARIRLGDPRDPDTDIGPLISREHRARVDGLVRRARDEAEVLVGGAVVEGPGAFYPPTIIVNCDQGSEIVQQEVFGPVLTLMPFKAESEAVRLANDVAYGLASSVWTKDLSRALEVTHSLEFGTTWINDHLPVVAEMPHGGVKQSGFGKDMSIESVAEFTYGHHVLIKHAAAAPREGFRPA